MELYVLVCYQPLVVNGSDNTSMPEMSSPMVIFDAEWSGRLPNLDHLPHLAEQQEPRSFPYQEDNAWKLDTVDTAHSEQKSKIPNSDLFEREEPPFVK